MSAHEGIEWPHIGASGPRKDERGAVEAEGVVSLGCEAGCEVDGGRHMPFLRTPTV